MAKSEAIKVAVIGCGYWGKNLVRNFAELGNLAAVFDASSEHAARMAEQHGTASMTFDDILNDPSIHGVAIAAPAKLHAELSAKALNAGKDVFIEKPIALTIGDAKYIADIAAKKSRILMTGHLLQYHPIYQKLREIVANGTIGTLKYIQSNRMSFGKIRNEEDVLWSFAPHDISMALGLTSTKIRTLHADAQTVIGSNHPDIATIIFTTEEGVQAQVNVSWISSFKQQKLIVVCEKGTLIFDDTLPWQEKLLLTKHEADKTQSPPHAQKHEPEFIAVSEAEPLKEECRHFIDCIANRTQPITAPNEAISVLEVLTEAERQIKRKQGQMTTQPDVYVHETSYVDNDVTVGKGTKIWHFSHILPQTTIGESCVISQNCMIGPNVVVGNGCKIQNNVSLYKGVTLEDQVFCGPSCVFTNVNNPRAGIERKDEFRKTIVRKGSTIGANATIVCGHELGAYCFIAAGAVVTQDVPPHAMMAGVPAKQIGWMSHAGVKLGDDLVCPIEQRQYRISGNKLEEIDVSKKSA